MIALDIPLAGVRRVEASAGTGKTWTVAAIVARAIAEGRVDVRGIVVVTYTRAATHELRGRIRERLVATKRVLEGNRDGLDASDVLFYDGLLRSLDDRERAGRRVEAALSVMDEAALFTIHGFCQRVLSDRAFEAQSPFETDLVQDPGDLLQEAVDAYWRTSLYDADPDVVRAVVGAHADPEALTATYRGVFSRHDLAVLAPEADLAACEEFREACDALAPRLAAEREDLLAWFSDTAFNRNKVSLEKGTRRLDLLGVMLDAREPDRLASGELDQVEKLRPEYVLAATKKNREAPPPPSDLLDEIGRLLDLREAALDAMDGTARAFEARAVREVPRGYRERKRRRGVVDFDDLLVNLRDALAGDGGDALAERIRRRYPLAVVDEFQDTDPVQWEIFRRVYGAGRKASGLVLVGDPKQAIYGFRGADVFTYLAAGDEVDDTLRLDRNWRSHPALVEAVNAVFGPVADPFAVANIPYVRVEPARRPEAFEPTIAGAEPGMRFRLLPQEALGGRSGTTAGREVAAEAAADRCARWIGAGVAANDIAVLVRSGYEGALVRDALGERGIRTVLRTHESVFRSDSADDLGRILRALAVPGDERRVRAALATVTLGVTGEELVEMAERGEPWDAEVERWRSWHEDLVRRGPARALREVLSHHDVESRLLARADGTRRLTDLAHLAERIQEAWGAGAPGVDRLLRWYADRRSSGTVADEDEALRLESDEHLVRIETMHASKGLEYEYVLVPFPWAVRGDGEGGSDDPRYRTFHDEDGRLVLDLRGDDDPVVVERARREDLSENLRLLYVALTRAKRRCEVFWLPTGRYLGRAALAWLLHDGDRASVTSFADSAQEVDEDGWEDALHALAARAPDAIEIVRGLPEPAGAGGPATAGEMPARRVFAGTVRPGRVLTSFTALAERLHDPAAAIDRPDWDVEAARAARPSARDDGRTRHTFPAGAGAGRALHRAFESIDYRAAAADEAGEAVRAALVAHGFDADWEPVVRAMIRDALATPIDGDGAVRLETVGRNDRAVELAFDFPATGADGSGVDGRALAEAIRSHAEDAPWSAGPVAEEVERIGFRRVRGHVRGFVDLLARAPGADGAARYWVVDWKSNRLGSDAAAYTRDAMEAEIARHAYWLQYLLYTVATHRFLATRLPRYDYDHDFGGVAYVFVRGCDPARPDLGVFRDRPSRALVEAVDRALGGGR